MCNVMVGCACREAVMRAYGELRDREVPNVRAFEAALTVFRFHHPEIPAIEAKYTISEWIGEGE